MTSLPKSQLPPEDRHLTRSWTLFFFYQTNRKKYCARCAEVSFEFLKIVLLSGGHKSRNANKEQKHKDKTRKETTSRKGKAEVRILKVPTPLDMYSALV